MTAVQQELADLRSAQSGLPCDLSEVPEDVCEAALRAVVPAPMGGDCGQCGRPMYSCQCDFGV